MSKIAKKWQITIVKAAMLDGEQSVELTHDQNKENWHVTFKGDFYTEFTFINEEDAEAMYSTSLGSSLYMDSLLIGVPSPSLPLVVEEISPDAVDYKMNANNIPVYGKGGE